MHASQSNTELPASTSGSSNHLHFPSLPEAREPSMLELHCQELKDIICRLPTYGTVQYDIATRYWYIKLPNEWQNVRDDIVSFIKETYSNSPWYTESEQLCSCWNDMVNAVHPQNTASAVINCVPPPSVVGMFAILHEFY